MFSLLFHKDNYLPEGVQELCKQYQATLVRYYLSKHFEEHLQRQEDRSHTYLREAVIECLNSLKDRPQEVFEVELSKDFNKFGKPGFFITKYCCRIHYSNDQDIVVAIRPQYDGIKVVDNMIVTAWMNARDDHHFTLDKTKYCSEEYWKEAKERKKK